MTENPRTTCCAFGCKRGTRRIAGGPGLRWFLCAKHWPLVPRRLRRLSSRAYRKAMKTRTKRDWDRVARLWCKCIDQANRNQFGI